jgi:hypothetical protein
MKKTLIHSIFECTYSIFMVNTNFVNPLHPREVSTNMVIFQASHLFWLTLSI